MHDCLVYPQVSYCYSIIEFSYRECVVPFVLNQHMTQESLSTSNRNHATYYSRVYFQLAIIFQRQLYISPMKIANRFYRNGGGSIPRMPFHSGIAAGNIRLSHQGGILCLCIYRLHPPETGKIFAFSCMLLIHENNSQKFRLPWVSLSHICICKCIYLAV